jgi:hypothetical protein
LIILKSSYENVKKITAEINEKVKVIDNIKKISDLYYSLKRNYDYKKDLYEREVSKLKKSNDYIFRKEHYDKEIEKLKQPFNFNFDTQGKNIVFNGDLFLKLNENMNEEKITVFLFTDSILFVKIDPVIPKNNEDDIDHGYEYIDYISLKYNEDYLPWVNFEINYR